MKIRDIFFIIFLFLCGSLYADAKQNTKNVSLQLKWNHQFQFAGYYAALEKGFYKDAGLNVALVELKNTKEPYLDVLNGKKEFGVYTSELLLKYNRGDGIVALGAIFQHSPLALMTLKGINLDNPKNLKNKKIMLEDGSAELEGFLGRGGIKLHPDNMIPHTHDLMPLIKKQVDAISVYTTDEPYFMEKNNIKYNLFSPRDNGVDFYGDILFTSKKFAKENPELVLNFKKASIKGWEYALSHPEEIVDIILKKYNTSNKTKEQLLFEAKQMQKLIKSETVEIGYLYPWRLRHMLDVYDELGMAGKNGKQNLDEFILENYLDAISLKTVSLTDKEKQYLKQKQTLTICVDPDWLPLERITKTGKHEGISADIFKEISNKLNIPIKLIPTSSWEETIENAKNRKCDILPFAMETKERKKYLTFTEPYFASPLGLVTKADQPFLPNPLSALDKPIGIVKGYAIVETLKRKYPDIRLIEVKDRNDGLEKTLKGEIFGYIDALACISYSLSKEGWSGLKVSGKLDDEFRLSAAVRNDEPILSDIIEKGLKSISKQQKDAIFNHWFSVVIKEGLDYFTALKWLGGGLLVIAALYYRNLSLKRKISEEAEKMAIQEKLLVAQSKNAQMGELIDITAHQWKQPLSSISLIFTDLLMSYEYGELNKKLLDESKNIVSERIGFLLKTLENTREFLNPNQPSQEFGLQNAANEMSGILQGIFSGLNVEIVVDIDESLTITGSKNSFQNIILSMASNSKDIFKSRNIKNPVFTVTAHTTKESIVLSIEDNGGGIETDVIDRIFDYRFTTKTDSGGTGIGLYLVKLIVKEKFGGNIKASNTDKGARFEIYL